jgi:hypothetical protein
VRSPADKKTVLPADKLAEELEIIKEEPSSCEMPPPPPPPPAAPSEAATTAEPPKEEILFEVTRDDREIAKEALTLRALRKTPRQTPPSWWDNAIIELVALRVAQTTGSREEKLDMQKHALLGAWLVSRERAPTVRFIWAEQEHFLEHVESGRKKAHNDAWFARTRAKARPSDEAHSSPALASPPALQAQEQTRDVTIVDDATTETPTRPYAADDSAPCAAIVLPPFTPDDGRDDDSARPTTSAPPSTPAAWARMRRADEHESARAAARELARKRIEACRAAAALLASWEAEGNPEPPAPCMDLRAACREVEAELEELRRTRQGGGARPAPA